MEEIRNSIKVCVTGGSGYIASWLVKKLLEKGYTVHATLRNLDDKIKVGLLESLPYADTKLVLFQADIYNPTEFGPAIEGCHYVFHVATPLQHNTQSSKAYTNSKTLAEKQVLSYNEIEDGKLEVVSLACGLVGGDNTLLSHLPGSVAVFLSQITGNLPFFNNLRFLQELLGSIPLVHIDDVCEAHIFCLEKESVGGRFMCAAAEATLQEIASYYQENYPQFKISQEFKEGPEKRSSCDNTKLMEMGFHYKNGVKDILNGCVDFGRRLQAFSSY